MKVDSITTIFRGRRYYIDKKKPFPSCNWKAGEWTEFTVKTDGDNIVVNGYSMPVKDDNEYAFQCKKTFIKSQGGAQGLYRQIEKEHGWNGLILDVVNWIVNFGKKEATT